MMMMMVALLMKIPFRCSNFNKQLLIINKNKYFEIGKIVKSSLANVQFNYNTNKLILNQFLNKTVRFSSSPINDQQHENTQSKALVLISDLKELRSSPRPALTVALLGLLPLALPPFYFIYGQTFASPIAFEQLAYGTLILSFLGGIQWGHTLTSNRKTGTSLDGSTSIFNNWKSTGWSVVPCLVGWLSLLMPLSGGLLSAAVGHGLVLYRDMTSIGTYPSWFRALRFILSLVAIMALWTSYICFYVFDEKKKSKITLQSQKA